MDFTDLTPRQKSVLVYIIDYQRQHAISPTVREIAKYLGLTSPGGIHRVLNVLKDKGYLKADELKKRSWRTTKPLAAVGGIPLVGAIGAGDPIESINHIEEELEISPSIFGCDACFGFNVVGDSMIDAHIMDGDIAIIRRQTKVADGTIAAVLVEELLPEATLKIFQRTPTTISLKPANRRYKPIVLRGKNRQRVSVIGKLVGVVRRKR